MNTDRYKPSSGLSLSWYFQQADSLLLHNSSLKKSLHTHGSSDAGWRCDVWNVSKLQSVTWRFLCYPVIILLASKTSRIYIPWPGSPMTPVSSCVYYCQKAESQRQLYLQGTWGVSPHSDLFAPLMACLTLAVLGSHVQELCLTQ